VTEEDALASPGDSQLDPTRPTGTDHVVPVSDLPGPEISTPLEHEEGEQEDETGHSVPPAPLWAMKDRRHYFALHGHGDVPRIRESFGIGDETLYFIDDGNSHCMLGRRVGKTPDGCVYCLVGRIKMDEYEDLKNGTVRIAEAFSPAHDVSLCGVYEDEEWISEVILVQHYRHASDVPPEYLPPSPFIEFTEDLPTEG
jgi:hypothetical protein